MKTTKRLISALLAALLTFSLAACDKGSGDGDGKVDNPTQTGDGGGKGDISATQTGSDDFQKNMHQSNAGNIDLICETETGYYFQYYGVIYTGALFYIDKGTNKATICVWKA